MFTLLKIAGGVALLLFGVRYLRKGLDRIFGDRLGLWLQRLGTKRGLAFLTGVGAGVLAPSSTTMSVLAVQTVQAGHMNARQMLAVMLGANVGLTVLVQLIALHVDEYAPLLILVGFVLFQYTRSTNWRGTGQIILALGFFFLAMSIIKSAATGADLGPHSDLAQVIEIAERYPLLLVLIAVVMATVLQSATATIGVVIGLGVVGAVGMEAAVPVVIGANVGLAITTLIVGWRQIESRRLGMANLLLKIIVAVGGLLALPWLLRLAGGVPGQFAAQVAHLHTGFNLVQALLGLLAIGVVHALVVRMVPERPLRGEPAFGPKFIHRGQIESLTIATGLSMREILHMSEIVRSMLEDIWRAMKTNDEQLAHEVSQRDDKVDLLDREIKRFLTRLAHEEIDDKSAREEIRQLQYLTELENVGDIIDKNVSELVVKKIRMRARFTPEGERELDDFYRRVLENLVVADTVFSTRDRQLAQTLIQKKEELNQYEQELRDQHFARLNAGLQQAHETSALHLDLLTYLKRINSSLSHVAYAIVQNGRRTAAEAALPAPPAVT